MTPTPDSDLQLLTQAALFDGLTETQLRTIQQHAALVKVPRRSFFFHQGEAATTFYLIREGQVRLSQVNPEGKQVIIHLFGPGDVLAVIVVLSNAPYPLSAEAITDCVAWAWSRETAVHLMEQCPRLAINGMEMVARRFQELQNRYRELSTERVEQRVARALIRLIQQRNGSQEQKPYPLLSLTRQDLAEMTGTTLYTVSRICSSWEQQGLLEAGREQLHVHNLEELSNIADDLRPSAANFPPKPE
ncbi:MAG: Crp/Fnr family transcriptional regulator [Anaerolineae bacterium]|nr:Crp/Fnr family transcriptional regulator [Anaerolineae bacterium]